MSEHKKQQPSDRKTVKELLSLKPVPDSHPLFARGFVIGGRVFNRNCREPETGKRN